eukprot:gene8687-17946_t
MEGNNSDVQKVTLKQLKTNLKDALRKSGVLDNVKAQIRKEFISSLSGKQSKFVNPTYSLNTRILSSLIHHYFKRHLLTNALSVFAAECGLEAQTALSEEDIIQAMHFGPKSFVHRTFLEFTNRENSTRSLLEMIIEEAGNKAFSGSVDIAIQTDTNGQRVRDSLDFHIREIQSSYSTKKDLERLTPVRTIEERMLIFQREVEERYRRELTAQLEYIRENEISKMRLEENQKARASLDILRREYEEEYQKRLQIHIQKEAENIQNTSERERNLQHTQYEARQRMQLEMDNIRNREIASTRKIELETQGLRSLENRLKESQYLLESREKEISRRENEIENIAKEKGEKARIEAKNTVQNELDLLMRERATIRLERQRLDEDRSIASSELEVCGEFRKKLHESQNILMERDLEIQSLQKRLFKLEISRVEELKEIEQITRSTSLGIAGIGGGDRDIPTVTKILTLAQRNIELETRVKMLTENLQQTQSDLARLRDTSHKLES